MSTKRHLNDVIFQDNLLTASNNHIHTVSPWGHDVVKIVKSRRIWSSSCSIMATKVQQTSHHPFKSLSDSDLSSAAAGVGNLSTSSNGNVERKRVTINDDASTNDSSSTDKSKTLPSKAKQTLTLKRTNSLKRSITLPRWEKTIVCQLVYLKTGFWIEWR